MFLIKFLFSNDRLKENLKGYITFIPSNLVRDDCDELINDRNAIAILTRSCAKAGFQLKQDWVSDNHLFSDESDITDNTHEPEMEYDGNQKARYR